MTTDRDRAVFEAGIKLGALYHQWVGTPVSPPTAPLLAEAIARSVGLQPYVEAISVRLDTGLMHPNQFGYSELAGLMLDVEITTAVGDSRCHACLHAHNGYPLMEISS